MKSIQIILTMFVLPFLVFSSVNTSGDVIGNPDGSYDVTMATVYFHYEPDGTITISQFGVSATSVERNVVFTFIEGGPFNPLQPPIQQGRTVSVSGANASLDAHDNHHATMVYRAESQNSLTFSLDSKMGAISSGSTVLLGNDKIRADLVVSNQRTITKSVDVLNIRLESDDVAIFRVQGPIGSVSDLLSSGTIRAEIDVRTTDHRLDYDLTSYKQNALISIDSIASSKASFSFSDIGSDGMFIIDLSQELYTTLKGHTTISVDGKQIGRYSDLKDLESQQDPGFVIAEGSEYVEMVVRPGADLGSLIIDNVVPGLDAVVVITAMASVALSVAAAVYLFRGKRQ